MEHDTTDPPRQGDPMTGEAGRGHPQARPGALEAVIRRAQAALLWERAWPSLALAGAVVLAFLSLSWFGLFVALPPAGRAAAVVLFGLALFAALYPLLRLARPSRPSALARIDRESRTRHRPATALDDPLASSGEDPVTAALWAAHRARTVDAAKNLKAGYAHPRLAARDPRALRFAALLAALIAFVSAGDDRLARTLSAFDWRSPAGGVPPRMDAWVTPPPYTGRPPLFLTSSRAEEASAAVAPDAEQTHKIPAGSVLVIRTSGGTADISAPGGHELAPGEKAPAAAEAPRALATEGVAERRFVLDRDTEVSVKGAGNTDFAWRFAVVPDTPPVIAFRAPPRLGRKGTLTLDYTASDDYGVASAEAKVALPQPRRAPRNGGAAAAAPRPLYGPPEIRLVLPQGRGRSGDAMTNLELAEHPWAGTRVVLTLVARDEPGQEGRSESIETLLPARLFTHPLARALIEQRRTLALDANAKPRVIDALDALSLYPEKFTPDASVYLGLRTASSRLFYARTDEDLRDVVDYLWQIALKLEDGDLPGLENQLKQAEQALREALERDASDEEIKQLMDQLREALGKFMEEMARRMEQQSQGQQAQLPPGARVLTPQDLKNMLDRMEEFARNGNRQAAQNLLSELRDLLNNLQTAQPGGQMDEGAEAAARALDELGRMIREQSELRDRTFRERQPGQGQRQQGRNQRGQPGEQGQPGMEPGENPLGQLGQEQGALRQRLEQLLKELEGKGIESDPALGDAGEEMGTAEGELGEGDANRAFNAQGRALEALRKGAQGMAERMQGQGQGQAQEGPGQQPGPRGQTAGQEDTDPLGRPTRARRYDPGSNVRVPGEIEAQRARRILEELRRRIGEPDRPQGEIDYLERLLRD